MLQAGQLEPLQVSRAARAGPSLPSNHISIDGREQDPFGRHHISHSHFKLAVFSTSFFEKKMEIYFITPLYSSQIYFIITSYNEVWMGMMENCGHCYSHCRHCDFSKKTNGKHIFIDKVNAKDLNK